MNVSRCAVIVLVCLATAQLPISALADCPRSTKEGACFVVNGTHFIGNSSTADAMSCCAKCESTSLCDDWQWNWLNNTNHPGNCYLVSGPAKIKIPKHLSQTQCTISVPPPPPPPPPLPPAPPGALNVVYILVDDLRTQLNEAYGHKFMHTPNLDAFAKESVVFTQAHCNSQMCVPTRNSFMSGRRPDVTRVFNDGIGEKHFRIVGENWTSFPQYFKEHGYFTVGVGKSFHPNLPPNFDQPMSWSNETEFPYYYPKPTSCDPPQDVWCRIDNETAIFEDDLILAEGQRRLHAAASDPTGRPFFVAIGFHKPHTPYRSPGSYFDLYPEPTNIPVAAEPNFPTDQNLTGLAWFSCKAEGAEYPIDWRTPYSTATAQLLRRAYYAAVSFTDHHIGEVLKTMDELRITEKTITILHADHGYQLGERNIWCKETCFNDATHVPFIVRAPMYHGRVGRRVNAMVELVDVMPTAIELARLPPFDPTKKSEPPLGGNSFASLVYGTRLAQAPSIFNASFSQYGRVRCVNNLFEDKNCTSGVGHFIGYSIRTANWRYTRWVNVSVAGYPFWSSVIGEELYRENVTSDDYDQSERHNIRYGADIDYGTLKLLRDALAAQHGQADGTLAQVRPK